MAEAFEIEVRVERGGFDLTAEIRSGSQAIGITGPSGAGKSTLLRTVAGLERTVRGQITIMGERWLNSETNLFVPPWARSVGWVPQDSLLFPHMNVSENLRFGSDADRDTVRTVADLLSISPLLQRRPRNLSGGERQRVALGRALLSARRLLLFDEPLSALDRSLREDVTERIGAHLRRSGRPFVLVSHDAEDLAALVDERWEVREGRVRQV